jgi:acyl carrier protein
MSADDILAKLSDIMQETFNISGLELAPAMTAKDVKGWDSMSNIRLVVAVEEAFAVSLSTSEVIGIENVGNFVALIQEKIG